MLAPRVVLLAFVLGLFAAPLAADAPLTGKVYRIGLLRIGHAGDGTVNAFVQGLRELGYIEGQNIVIQARTPKGSPVAWPGWPPSWCVSTWT